MADQSFCELIIGQNREKKHLKYFAYATLARL